MSTDLAVVLGDGVAGCLAAITLKRRFRRVVLIGDGRSDPRGDFLMTVTPRWADHLSMLGICRDWDAWSGKCRVEVQLSGWGRSSLIAENGLIPSQPRYLVSRNELESHLRAKATAHGVESWSRRVTFDRSPGVTVDATGRSANFARRGGAKWRSGARLLAHKMIAPRNSLPKNSMALLSSDEGWWFAASTGGQVTVTLMSDLNRSSIQSSLQTPPAIRELVGDCRLDSSRLATMSWLESCSGEGWFAVGDAALAVDPLCGAGLEMAAASATFLDQALGHGDEGSSWFNSAMLGLIAEQRVARHRLYLQAAHVHREGGFWRRHGVL